MKTRIALIVLVLLAVVLVACGGAPEGDILGAGGGLPVSVVEPQQPPSAPNESLPAAGAEAPASDKDAAPGAVTYNTGSDSLGFDRMVIKNGEIELLVKNSDVAIDGVTQLVGDLRGYIVSSQFWLDEYYGTNYKHASMTISIPADQFETALRRLRNLSIRVLNETASGQDVTDQYVDLQAQLTNLEATRDRIQSFLADAKTVDEALKINQQLSDIEAQIEQVKGKMNYLSNSSAFSTISITVTPDLPVIVFTPTPTSTPLPTPTPVVWKPGETAKASFDTLKSAYQGITDFLIWFFVVLVPILAPWVFLGWVVVRLVRRKPKA